MPIGARTAAKIAFGIALGILWGLAAEMLFGKLIAAQPAYSAARANLRHASVASSCLLIPAGIWFALGAGRRDPSAPSLRDGAFVWLSTAASACLALILALPAAGAAAGLILAICWFGLFGDNPWPWWSSLLLFGVPLLVFLGTLIPLIVLTRKMLDRLLLPLSRRPALRTGAAGAFLLSAAAALLLLRDKNSILAPGPGEQAPGSVAVRVAQVPDARTLVLGEEHLCALLAEGRVACWGKDFSRDPGVQDRGKGAAGGSPLPLQGIVGARALSSGDSGICVLLQGGTPLCLGDNRVPNPLLGRLPGIPSLCRRGACAVDKGELLCVGGLDGRSPPPEEPVRIDGLLPVRDFSCGSGFYCALTLEGRARCWGSNEKGQVGDGVKVRPDPPIGVLASFPRDVVGLSSAVMVVSGEAHTCALLEDGSAACWGDNSSGQLGDGSTALRSPAIAAAVQGLRGATALAAGAYHTCALLSSGGVDCWGDNREGEIGDGKPGPARPSPSPVPGVRTARSIAAHGVHTCALLEGGEIRCWGGAGAMPFQAR